MSQGWHCKEKLETSLSWGLKVKVYEKLVVGDQIQEQEKPYTFYLPTWPVLFDAESWEPPPVLLVVGCFEITVITKNETVSKQHRMSNSPSTACNIGKVILPLDANIFLF